jgi:nucleotide-binding universal stress UspA family protein
MNKKILLATDFSNNAWNAIVYALALYKDTACDFYILNTFTATAYLTDSLMVPEPGQDAYEEARAESENGLTEVSRMITFREENNSKHTFTIISLFDNLREAIDKVVEEKDIELVVMGTKGQTNTSNFLFGSNAVDVMEKIRNCPVLVIPEEAESKYPREIVFPTSYKTHIKRHELNHLVEIAKISQASIKILHINKEDKLDERQINNQKLLQEYFADIDYSFHSLSHMEIASAINCFVESRESDMIAFINKKHTFFGSIFSQPLVKNITYHTKVPVLVMHDLRN